jgi:hypothetical protein
MEYETETRRHTARRDIDRMAYALRLWVADALLMRLNNYNWERRRRLMRRYDSRRRAR